MMMVLFYFLFQQAYNEESFVCKRIRNKHNQGFGLGMIERWNVALPSRTLFGSRFSR